MYKGRSRDKLPFLKHIALIDLGLGGRASRPRTRARPSRPRARVRLGARARASGRGQFLVD